jgi:O-antigen/teichoic acid export membrane protein
MVEVFRHSWPNLLRSARLSFFRQTVGTYGTQMAMAALSLASSAIIARALGPAGRGDYAVAMAIGLLGIQLGTLGLNSTNSYLLAKDRTLLPPLLANSLLASFLVGGAGAVVLGGVMDFSAQAPIHGRLLWLAVLRIPFGIAYLLVVNLFMGLLEVRLYNTIELVNKTLVTALIVATVWLGARTPEMMLLVLLFGMIISFIFALGKLNRFFATHSRPSMTLFRENFPLGWKAYLCSLFSFLVIRIDLLMVKFFLGATAAGYYSIAGNSADFLLLLPAAVSTVLFPKLSSMSHDTEKRALALKAVGGTGLGLLPLLLVIGMSANFVIVRLFGKAFAPATPALLLLLPGILFLSLETVLVQYLNSCGFPRSVVAIWILSAAFNILANLWAIPAYGINGASVVSSVSYFGVLLGVTWVAYSRPRTPSPAGQSAAAGIEVFID